VKALIFQGVGKNKLEGQERPDLTVQGDLEAIVRPIASATCDLDREIIRGTVAMSQHPGFAIGHECVAEVLEVGDKVRLSKRGDIVVVPCFISCGFCVQCRAGMHSHCTTVSPVASERVYGLPTGKKDWGGLFSEEVRVPFADGMLVPVPAGVDPVAVASASDNMVDSYITVRRGLAKHPGASTLVVGGLDSFGLFMAEQALAQGSERVDYYDRDPQRRAAARLLGCEVFSEMPAVDRHYPFVIFASTSPAELERAVRAMAPGGHIQLLTLFFGGPVTINLWEMFMRDVTLALGVPNSKSHIPAVLEQVRCGHIHPERLITVHDWTEVPEALYASGIKPVVVRPTINNPATQQATLISAASD
jgi:threonine dehydrogenase-like Zn-dependent dehydrogenase